MPYQDSSAFFSLRTEMMRDRFKGLRSIAGLAWSQILSLSTITTGKKIIVEVEVALIGFSHLLGWANIATCHYSL